MTQYKRIGIDTSKAVFTLHGIDQQDRPELRINRCRAQMISFFRKLPTTVIAQEACGSSHYWAHELTAVGHSVRLIPPQYVKPYVKRGKNDRNDAEAICEAAGRQGMHFVPAKSITQKAQGRVLKVRETLIGQRTALIDMVRPISLREHFSRWDGMAKPRWSDTKMQVRSHIFRVWTALAVLAGCVCGWLYVPEALTWWKRSTTSVIETVCDLLPYPWGDRIEATLGNFGIWVQITFAEVDPGNWTGI